MNLALGFFLPVAVSNVVLADFQSLANPMAFLPGLDGGTMERTDWTDNPGWVHCGWVRQLATGAIHRARAGA
ncbi:hypothetical protein GCM10022293_20390 [Azospirillum formosense]